MGMQHTPEGLVPSIGVVEDALQQLYQSGEALGTYEIVTATPLIDSSAIEPSDWNWIGTQITDRYEQFDGFVVVHGTDTLAYTACALTFGLEGLDKPVIVTGSMVPLVDDNSDGQRNLQDAIIASNQAPAGVWVQFAGKRMHGARVRKNHSSALDAFFDAEASAPPRHEAADLKWRDYRAFNLPVITFVPGMSGQLINDCLSHADGLILRCYGAGTLPDKPEINQAIETAKQDRKPVIAVSTCAEGGIALDKYAPSARLMAGGVIDGKGATAAAAYVKLLYALSQNITDLTAFLAEPICGELG